MTSPVRTVLRRAKEELLLRSLNAAGREQGLDELAARLDALGGVEDQYTSFTVGGEYLRRKVLLQNAFQIAFASEDLPRGDGLVVDIGDSSGRHTLALKAVNPGTKARFLSANLDATAVAKIRAKGLEAEQGRAEDLTAKGIDAEVFLLFETLEHLPNPFQFLHDLATKSSCRRLVLTVPLVRRSRLGLHHIRAGLREKVGAERVHLLELCPEDLKLLFSHTGWKVERERTYLQYPLLSPLRAARAAWRRFDFEGFYGVSLSRDDSWSRLYADW